MTMKKKLIWMMMTALCLLVNCCSQQVMQRQVAASRTVVLDIGHYYVPGRGGQGARTPDARYGSLEECEFWYRYAIYTKRVIEQAGYTCIICNRGALPSDPALARCAREAGVVQLNTPSPTAIYRSKHHPFRLAVGMRSADYALDQKPAAVVFLHHNSDSETWRVSNKGAFYCNEAGRALAASMARVMDRDILDKGMPNGGVRCAVRLRNDGRLGGGDWLNTCNESYVPAVLTEVAFLSNPEHAAFLSKRAGAIRYAQAVGRGVVEYLQAR